MSNDDAWNRAYLILQQFALEHGHARVPRAWTKNGFALGQWAYRQRHAHAQGALPKERCERLENVTGWVWDVGGAPWRAGLDALYEYVDRTGDARVPRAEVVNGLRLGEWVGAQRSRYARGQMESERRAILEKVPGWSWDVRGQNWEQNYRLLEDWLRVNGQLRVGVAEDTVEAKLGQWVHNQRCQYTRGELDDHRRRKLEALPGWSWDRYAQRWERRYAELLEYCLLTVQPGTFIRFGPNAAELRRWVYTQRRHRAKGTLNANRAARLESLPGWTWRLREGRTTNSDGSTS